MILYSRWCALSLATRNVLAQAFGIKKKGSTEVSSNVVRNDGYLVQDIEDVMTTEAMQNYVVKGFTDKTTAEQLWQMVVDKAEGRFAPVATGTVNVLPPAQAKKFTKEYKSRKKNA